MQLKENLTALEVVPLMTNEVMDEIDQITGTKPQVVIP
jgi:aryl-alcohol dehydrogenase-like predicted oxidoreductase